MRVLQVAPLISPIDERGEPVGGAQVLLADLARGLARRGHQVTLAAAEGSCLSGVANADIGIDSARLRPAKLGATQGARSDAAEQRAAFARVLEWVREHAAQLDIVHAHAYDAPAFDALREAPVPVVHTLHLAPLDEAVVSAARRAREATLVTVSESNARAWRDRGVPVAAVVHNGIDVAAVAFSDRSAAHLVCAGRISPEKGTHLAVEIAQRGGWPLLVIGGVYDREYFADLVEPNVRAAPDWRAGDPVTGVIYVGPRRRQEVIALVGSSSASLLPVTWDEPFGLVALESLAAGTPVVAFRRGGLAEIVDRTSGELVAPGDERGFEQAIPRATALDRRACRARAERFSIDAMLAGYERIYRSVAA